MLVDRAHRQECLCHKMHKEEARPEGQLADRARGGGGG